MKGKRILAMILSLALIITTAMGNTSFAKAEIKSVGTTYYVDSENGNDSSDGTSEATAWKSIEKVNAITFEPGDTLSFKRGGEWTCTTESGALHPLGSGEAGNPITINAYGNVEDGRPVINGNSWCGADGDNLEDKVFNTAVYFYNQEYWNITDIEVTNFDPEHNTADGTDESHIKKYGILIMGQDAGTLHEMNVNNTFVHSVISIPIGSQAGIGRGGIIYAIRGTQTPTNWADITVEGNYVKDVNHYGIDFISSWGSSIFTAESGISESGGQRYNSTGLVIRGNYLENIGNAAICPSDYEDALIEYNICNTCNSGPNGNVPIWWEYGKKTIAQYNEVFGSGASDSKEDSQAFDADVYADLNYVQYNYTHDNPSGSFFECSIGTSFESYYRYNISVNDGYGSNIYDGGAVVTLQNPRNGSLDVYNNLIYMDAEHDGQVTSNWDGSGTAALTATDKFTFTNNVIITETENGEAWNKNYMGVVDNNAYGGANLNNRREDDANAKEASVDDFVDLAEGTSGTVEDVDGKFVLTYGTVNQYKILESAGLIDEGKAILDNGGLDFFGNTVEEYVKPNIGADNSFNTGLDRDAEADEIYLSFNDVENGELTDVYKNCDFGNRGWNVLDKELYATSYTNDAQANKLAIPDNYKLTSFQARTTSGTATLKVDAGEESKTFTITEDTKVFTTNFELNNAAVYFVIEDTTNGVDSVRFDNVILTKEPAKAVSSTNVTKGKTVTTSSVSSWDPGCVGSCVVDGDTSTMWISNGWSDAGDEVTDYTANCVIDLDGSYVLTNMDITFGGDAAVSAWKYKVEASADNENWDLVWDQTENAEVAATQKTDMPSEFAEKTYSYIRVTFTDAVDNAWPCLAEFNAYQPEELENIALNKSVTTSTQSGYGNPSNQLVDGDTSSLWTADGNTEKVGAWATIDLGAEKTVKGFDITFEYDVLATLEDANAGSTPNYGNPYQYKVEGSTDNSTWDVLWDNTENTDMTKAQSGKIASDYADNQYRYIKVTLTNLPLHRESQAYIWPSIAELAVYGPAEVVVDDGTITLTEEGQNIDLDLAFSQTAKASSNTDNGYTDAATDRKDTTWYPADEDANPSLEITLDREYNIENFSVDFESEALPYKVFAKANGSWTEVVDCKATESGVVNKAAVSEATAVRFEFTEPTVVEVKEVHFDGVDAGVKHHKRILVFAPHEDDELLMAGGVMNQAVANGDEVYVIYGTNGDYNGVSHGQVRINDTIRAMDTIGVEKEHLFFLGYADNGGMGVGAYKTAFTDSFIYNLYMQEDENKVLSSRNGVTQTYGSDEKDDYHYETTGEHADYTRANFAADIKSVMEAVNPTDVYTQSRYDMHYDHAYFGMFAVEVINEMQQEDNSFNPVLHQGIIHSHMTDEVYPTDQGSFGNGYEDSTNLTAWVKLDGLDEKTALNWEERENVLVPYSMRQLPYKYNLKDQGLRQYSTEYYNWIASFAKANEVFYKYTFTSIANLATVTASSENSSTDKTVDQSAIKAVDGIADGYATGLADNHDRFPYAEWVASNETVGAWINLSYDEDKTITSVKLYDRPNSNDQITSGHLEFSDGSQIEVGELPNDGSVKEIAFEEKTVTSVKFVVDSVSASTTEVGLAEIEVFEKEKIQEPTTEEATTATSSTEEATTATPSTEEATTATPSTEEATTAAPSTEKATTAAPSTEKATTAAPKVTAPARGKVKKVNAKKKSAKKISLKLAQVKNAKGYEVRISKAKKFTKKNILVKKIVKKTKIAIQSKKLKNKTKLYIKVRAYVLDGKKKVYGKWSKAKKVKIK